MMIIMARLPGHDDDGVGGDGSEDDDLLLAHFWHIIARNGEHENEFHS